jgi:hypothetical protein
MATFGQTGTTGLAGFGALTGYVYFSGGQIGAAGTLTDVSLYVGSTATPCDAYVGVWKSATDDASTATLIADTGNITTVASPNAYNTYSLVNGTKTFSSGEWLWVGVLTLVDANWFTGVVVTDSGDFSAPTGKNVFNYRDTGGLSALPTPLGANTGYLATALAANVTYTAGGGTTRGMPFGNRSTAFNGGRVFTGPIY